MKSQRGAPCSGSFDCGSDDQKRVLGFYCPRIYRNIVASCRLVYASRNSFQLRMALLCVIQAG
jgi:hypothetical protein